MMMEDEVSLDHITTQNKFDLQNLCDNDDSTEEGFDSPYNIGSNNVLTMNQQLSKILTNKIFLYSVLMHRDFDPTGTAFVTYYVKWVMKIITSMLLE